MKCVFGTQDSEKLSRREAFEQIYFSCNVSQALGNAVKLLITKISHSKVLKNIKKMLQSKKGIEDNQKDSKAAAASKGATSLGDEVERSVSTAFF